MALRTVRVCDRCGVVEGDKSLFGSRVANHFDLARIYKEPQEDGLSGITLNLVTSQDMCLGCYKVILKMLRVAVSEWLDT